MIVVSFGMSRVVVGDMNLPVDNFVLFGPFQYLLQSSQNLIDVSGGIFALQFQSQLVDISFAQGAQRYLFAPSDENLTAALVATYGVEAQLILWKELAIRGREVRHIL